MNISAGGECDYENRVFGENVASNFVNFGYLCDPYDLYVELVKFCENFCFGDVWWNTFQYKSWLSCLW